MIKLLIVICFTLIYAENNAQSYFQLYDHLNSPIDENNLYSLAIDSSQVVWVGSYSYVYRFINDNWQDIQPNIFSDSLGRKYFIGDVQVSKTGEVWLSKADYGPSDNNYLYKYSNGDWRIYNSVTYVYQPSKIFLDGENKPWFVLVNWWPHESGYDKVGTIDADTLKTIDLPWRAIYFGDIIKIADTLLITAHSDSLGILKVFNDTWEIVGTKDWGPNHIWKDAKQCMLGGKKFCRLNGNEFYYYSAVDSFLQKHNTNVSSFVRENENTFWIGTDKGYLLKIINDSIIIPKEPGTTEISDLVIDKNRNKWMLIKNKGIYVFNENGIVNVNEGTTIIPTDFLLYQNYPNPFNPTTTIEYVIPARSHVKIEVFDVLGKCVETLVNREQIKGNYKINFDASGFCSGIYFYKISANNFVKVKKMVLIR